MTVHDEAVVDVDVFRSTQIVDTDSHVTEPPDLWTSRLPQKRWGDLVPRTMRDEKSGFDRWYLGSIELPTVCAGAMAGWPEFWPSNPPSIDKADPGCWQPRPRLDRLDEFGIHAQVLYPNVLGFHSAAFLSLNQPDLFLACVQAYNDFISEFAGEDPARLLPMTVLPFYDIEASVAEIERCTRKGHRGIVFGSDWEKIGFPALASGHWDPIFEAAQHHEMSINFHTAFSAFSKEDFDKLIERPVFDKLVWTQASVLGFLGNAKGIAQVILTGLADRFPRLNFVSVESGFGYIPYLLESADWMWRNGGAYDEYPGATLPSEAFHRQVYATFWFEREPLALVEPYADNVMFSSDYPHPTSLSPGPASYSEIPREMARASLEKLPADVVRKVLHANAARVYHLG
jgi:predicted TIM-barrel fold metal-dependent hydrolase